MASCCRNALRRAGRFIRREFVLCAAALCAALSAFFVPPSAAWLGYVDARVLCLLWCLMLVVAGFQQCGVFDILAQKLLSGRKTLRLLALILVLLPFFASMLVTNDVALITFVPFTILILGLSGHQGSLIPIIALQTAAANLGSMATPVGNPQNLFLYARYDMDLPGFLSVMLPLTLVSLAALAAAALFFPAKSIEVSFQQRRGIERPRALAVYAALFALCLLAVFRVLHYGVLTAVVAAAVWICEKKLLSKADYGLLLTFVFFLHFCRQYRTNRCRAGFPWGDDGKKRAGHFPSGQPGYQQCAGGYPSVRLHTGLAGAFGRRQHRRPGHPHRVAGQPDFPQAVHTVGRRPAGTVHGCFPSRQSGRYCTHAAFSRFSVTSAQNKAALRGGFLNSIILL